ncbi:MAG: hypothetical protein QOJ65_260 [Fimbriimonadaceae bacterium]|jgi:hypothetical protein|nr:hypothetical protein [Fimbriimonadaceae bacterium]
MHSNFAKPAALLAAGLVATLAIVTVQKAYATTTVPNATRMIVTLPGNSTGVSFAVPTNGAPVLVLATQLSVGNRSTGSTTLAYAPTNPELLSWSGVDSAQTTGNGGGGDSALNSGYTSAGGSVLLDFGWGASCALISVLDGAGNPSRLAVRNSSGAPIQFALDMIW